MQFNKKKIPDSQFQHVYSAVFSLNVSVTGKWRWLQKTIFEHKPLDTVQIAPIAFFFYTVYLLQEWPLSVALQYNAFWLWSPTLVLQFQTLFFEHFRGDGQTSMPYLLSSLCLGDSLTIGIEVVPVFLLIQWWQKPSIFSRGIFPPWRVESLLLYIFFYHLIMVRW